MTKPAKLLLIYIIILAESALALAAGMAALRVSSDRTIPPGVYAGEYKVGGIDRSSAASSLEAFYEKKYGSGKLEIAVNGHDSYYIDYADLGMHVEGKATIDTLYDWKNPLYILNLIPAYLGSQKTVISPVIRIDEGKLREKLIELKPRIDTAAVNASVELVDGKIVKKPEKAGEALDVAAAAAAIRNQLGKNQGNKVYLDGSKNKGMVSVPAETTLKDLDFIQEIVSTYTTTIDDSALNRPIKLSADAIDHMIVRSGANGAAASTFSFVDRLKEKISSEQYDDDAYDQVASTLYAAVLKAGIDKDGIIRLAHKLAPDYIEPGLDAWISGTAGDLQFKNSLGNDLMILTEVKGNSLTVVLAGKKSNLRKNYEIKTEIAQKSDPPVVNIVNNALKAGDRLLLSQGKPSMVVNVYRNDELLTTDKYDAVNTIMQVGPNTGFSDNDK